MRNSLDMQLLVYATIVIGSIILQSLLELPQPISARGWLSLIHRHSAELYPAVLAEVNSPFLWAGVLAAHVPLNLLHKSILFGGVISIIVP